MEERSNEDGIRKGIRMRSSEGENDWRKIEYGRCEIRNVQSQKLGESKLESKHTVTVRLELRAEQSCSIVCCKFIGKARYRTPDQNFFNKRADYFACDFSFDVYC